jgi:hypothetical protein
VGKYRKKPVVVEAVQWTGEWLTQAGAWVNSEILKGEYRVQGIYLYIHTLEGEMRAEPGDWIIKGVKGEFYPCKPDIFEATYEPTEEPSDGE